MKNPIRTTLAALPFCFAISFVVNAEVPGITSGAQLQAEAEARASIISTEDLQKAIENEPELVVIDIRMPSEIANMGGAIDAAQNHNIPRGWLEHRVTGIAQNKDVPIIVYCGAGIRSPMAAITLEEMGYTNVRDYPDGFIGWKKADLPVAE